MERNREVPVFVAVFADGNYVVAGGMGDDGELSLKDFKEVMTQDLGETGMVMQYTMKIPDVRGAEKEEDDGC